MHPPSPVTFINVQYISVTLAVRPNMVTPPPCMAVISYTFIPLTTTWERYDGVGTAY